MLSVNQAESTIINLVQQPKNTEIVTLKDASNRILASPIVSQFNFPYWDNSAMDGYAVRYEDVKNCDENNWVNLTIVAEIPAGSQPTVIIKPGQAARIFTGAMLPEGADTIVKQENTQRTENKVIIRNSVKFQEFVRKKGSFCQVNTPLLPAGIRLGAAEIAVLATAGYRECLVYSRPRVAILSTGNELVEPGESLQPGKIIDSNQFALASFVTLNGAITLNMGIVPDSPLALKKTITEALASADIILSTGGVSVGDYDYVDSTLQELGGDIQLTSVAIKPGKPLTVATFPRQNSSQPPCLYFGIPGNPVSALVSCWRFVQPALKKLSGLTEEYLPTFVQATTNYNLTASGTRETYLWGKVKFVNGNYEFNLASGSHNSANLINLAQTNALAIVPVGTKSIAKGKKVKVMLINI